MRNTFITHLTKAAETNNKIVLVVGDLGFGVVESFAEKFPDRFYNAGIAEQNMMGLCAGLASEGFHVFVYSIANFPTFRCAEQIRNDVDYHNLPVTVVSVGGGLAYGNLGYSHHAVQDFAFIRSLPNMLIASPGDPMETISCLQYLLDNPQPSYLRLGKNGEESFHASPPAVNPGEWVSVPMFESDTKDIFLTTGGGLSRAASWCKSKDHAPRSIYTLPLWGQGFKSMQAIQLQQWQQITSVEDHILDGGFGSWLLESSLTMNTSPSIKIKALNSSVFGIAASQRALEDRGGLD